MKKKLLIISLLFIITSSLYANNDTSLYINGLESITQRNDVEAIDSFNQLVDLYPSSIYKVKASTYIDSLKNKKNNSGIVPFYLNNIATLTYTTFGLANIFEIPTNTLSVGLSGLIGVGSGIGVSSLLSKEYEISSELYSRMFTNQAIAMGNYYYIYGILNNKNLVGTNDVYDKLIQSSQLATLNGSLYLSYFGLRNSELEKGKGFFSLQSYVWSNYYYWLTALMFERGFDTPELLLGMGVSDLAYIGSQKLWDTIKWSETRTGLVSVGGLGGALIGVFTNLILENYITLENKVATSILMGTTLSGQILAAYLTKDIDKNHDVSVSSEYQIMPYPIIKPNNEIGIGFQMTI